MPSGYETILADVVLARMTAEPKIVTDMSQVRRAHRTLIPELDSFSVHVVDGPDMPSKGKACEREGMFTISLFARSDLGPTVLDQLKRDVMRRLAPPWPDDIVLMPGRINPFMEIANKDAIRLDMAFDLCYPTGGEWSLDIP